MLTETVKKSVEPIHLWFFLLNTHTKKIIKKPHSLKGANNLISKYPAAGNVSEPLLQNNRVDVILDVKTYLSSAGWAGPRAGRRQSSGCAGVLGSSASWRRCSPAAFGRRSALVGGRSTFQRRWDCG